MQNGSNRRFSGDDNSRKDGETGLIYWGSFCFGHCPSLTAFLDSKKGLAWATPKFFNAVLRGIAQVLFANNPWSGLLILIGLVWRNYVLGGVVVVCTSLAVITALITKQSAGLVSTGLISFNAVLLASVTVSVWEPMYNEKVGVAIYTFVVVGSIFSICLCDGLSNLLSSFRPPIPVLSIPFHILILATFGCLKPALLDGVETSTKPTSLETVHTTQHSNNVPLSVFLAEDFSFNDSFTSSYNQELYSWETAENIILSVPLYSSQVYGFPDPFVGLLMYAAMFMYSPLIALFGAYGGLVSTLMGLFLTPFPNEQIFTGVYGFNGFLGGGAITLFLLFNGYSVLVTTANAIFIAVLQVGLTSLFAQWQLPVFGIPFLISSIIFMSMTASNAKNSPFIRLKDITFPELDIKRHQARISSENGMDEENAVRTNLVQIDAQ